MEYRYYIGFGDFLKFCPCFTFYQILIFSLAIFPCASIGYTSVRVPRFRYSATSSGEWINYYRCLIMLLSSIASGSSGPGGQLGDLTLGIWDFFLLRAQVDYFPCSFFSARILCPIKFFLLPCVSVTKM